MVYHGKVKNGVIVLDAPGALPEGARVKVEAEAGAEASWAEVFGDLIGKAEGLPVDFAENHDHYIHGTAKR